MKNNSSELMGMIISGVFSLSFARVFINYFNLTGESLDFLLVFISLIIFFGIELFRKWLRLFFGWEVLILGIISFFQTYFLNYSLFHFGVYSILCFVLWYISCRFKLVKYDLYIFLNSIFLSLPIFFILRSYSYSIFVFGVFLLMNIVSRLDVKIINNLFKNSLGFLAVVSLFYSNNIIGQIIIFLIIILSGIIINFNNRYLKRYLFAFSFLFLIAFNPLFSMGKIDSVEEGFWLAWWQRLSSGEVGYKDFWMYHPPVLVHLLKQFGNYFGETVNVMRAFFELLRLIGLGSIFFIVISKYKSLLSKVIVFLLVLILSESLVKNNVEIRLGIALLSVYFVSEEFIRKKMQVIVLIFSGLLCGISLGISLETGIAAFVSSVVVLLFRFIKQIKFWFIWLLGLVIGIFSWMTQTVLESGKEGFVQMYDYARSFSLGYLSEQIPLPLSSNLLRIENLVGYFSGNDFWWIVAVFGVLVILRLIGANFKIGKNYWIVGMGFFVLVMMRVVLGRSDWQHLVFILIPLVVVGGYFVDKLDEHKRRFGLVVICVCLFVFGKQQLSQFAGTMLVRWQSYGVFTGTTTSYVSEKSDIWVSGDVDLTDENRLLEYLDKEYRGQYLFVFPWKPELYFLSNMANPTKSDVPLAYLSDLRQKEVVEQLEAKKNKVVIVYDKSMGLGGLGIDSLKIVNQYILSNYSVVKEFKNIQVMVYFEGGKDK